MRGAPRAPRRKPTIMYRFALSRLGGALAVLLLVAVMVFTLTRLAAGDPVAILLGDPRHGNTGQ